MLAQLVVGFCGESGAGSRGHVIHDDGGMYPVSDVGVVLDKTGLSGLIIIRSDDEQAIHAAGLCVQGQIQGGHGAVAAGAGDDLDPMIDLLDAVFDGGLVFLDGLGGGFAGGAADGDGTGAACDLKLDQLTQLIKVNAIFMIGSHDSHTSAGKNRSLHRGNHPFNQKSNQNRRYTKQIIPYK